MKEKIKLLADLSSILEDEEVLSVLSTKSNGDRIVSIFKAALEREIDTIFNSKLDEILNPVNQLLDKIKEASTQVETLAAKTSSIKQPEVPLVVSRNLNIQYPTAPEVAGEDVSQFREPVRQGRRIDFD